MFKDNLRNSAMKLFIVPAYCRIRQDQSLLKNALLTISLPTFRMLTDTLIGKTAYQVAQALSAPEEPNLKIVEGIALITVSLIASNSIDLGVSLAKSTEYYIKAQK